MQAKKKDMKKRPSKTRHEAARKVAKTATANRTAGRPKVYTPEFNDQAERCCALGATDIELAGFLGIDEATLATWKYTYPELSKSIKKGKDLFDTEAVERSLRARALGYEHPEDKVFISDGCPVVVPTTKSYPPDTAAAIFWLKNRQSGRWRDKQEIDLRSGDGSMSPTQEAREAAKLKILESLGE